MNRQQQQKILKFSFCSFLILLFFFKGVQSQDEGACNTILQQGIYNTYSLATGSSQYSNFQRKFCDEYKAYSTDQMSAEAKAEFVGQFSLSGSGSGSSSQIDAVYSLLCLDTSTDQASQSNLQSLTQVVEPSTVAAYRDCLTQYASGLRSQTQVSSDQTQVTITLRYVAPSGADPQIFINGTEISPADSWSCAGPLWDLAQNQSQNSIGTQSASMLCTRNVSAKPFTVRNQSIFAPSSTISVMTSVGTIIRDFPPIYNGPVKDRLDDLAALINLMGPAVGDYKYSAQGSDHNGWLLCDGRSVSTNLYPQLFDLIGDWSTSEDLGTFKLPNFSGFIAAAIDADNALGTEAGEDFLTLDAENMPAHSHDSYATGTGASSGGTTFAFPAAAGTSGAYSIPTSSVGGSHPFDNRQSTLYVGNYFIYAGQTA